MDPRSKTWNVGPEVKDQKLLLIKRATTASSTRTNVNGRTKAINSVSARLVTLPSLDTLRELDEQIKREG